MRYAIVSDLHANLTAWNAVLSDIGASRVDRILCLGDIVGYGPEPARVLESAHRHVHSFVLGNHDAVVCGKMSADTFNDSARALIQWTERQIGRRGRDFLASIPLTLTGGNFRCTHGCFGNPAAFDYIIDPEDALASWQAVPEPLLFVGHTHLPGIFVMGSSGKPHLVPAQDFSIEPGKRYIINVGSVGSPRDNDQRACYVLYDEDTGNIVFRRIPFDLEAVRDCVKRAGLPTDALPILRHDPRRNLASVREQLDFSPAARPDQEVQGAIEVGDVAVSLQRKATRWRWIALTAILLSIIGIAGAFWLAQRGKPLTITLPVSPLEPMIARPLANAGANLLPNLPDSVGDDGAAPPWRVVYGDRRAQNIAVAFSPTIAEKHLQLNSSHQQRHLRIEAPPIQLGSGKTKLVITSEARRASQFSGHVGLVVDILRSTPDGDQEWVRNYQTVEYRQPRGQQVWETARKTYDFPKSTLQVQVALVGDFEGEFTVRNLQLSYAP